MLLVFIIIIILVIIIIVSIIVFYYFVSKQGERWGGVIVYHPTLPRRRLIVQGNLYSALSDVMSFLKIKLRHLCHNKT